ncbi:SPFH domain-containing protein [bacterium]|nr:SPFH domain-containing protein [candidate division CSSED10-310 bacterium]
MADEQFDIPGVTPFPVKAKKHRKKGIPRWIGFIGVLMLMCFVIYHMFLVYVRPGEMALKEVKIGINRGIQKTVYAPGLMFRKPFGLDQVHKFPNTLLVFETTDYPDSRSRSNRGHYRAEKAAHIQTSDGFFVDVDCSILYRIKDPYKVITTIGPGRMYEDNGIIPKAEPVLKQALGQLTTEEFYNSPLRFEKTVIARRILNEQLEDKGIHVEQVLVRYFKYSDEIQKNIEEKKLKDQLVFKNQSEAKAASEEATLKRVIQEGEANMAVKLEEGKAYIVQMNAEKDLYVRKRHAEADLLIKLAEAEKTELKNYALRTAGSDMLVGIEMAKNLKGIDVIILPSDGSTGYNPLDLRDSLNMFEVK